MKTKIVQVTKKRRNISLATSTLMPDMRNMDGKFIMVLAERNSDNQILLEFEEGELDTLKHQISLFEQ